MKILIIGVGSIGKKHIVAINSILPDAEIFALRSNINSEVFPGVTNIFSFDDISLLDIDFVIIANPTSEHKITIRNLLPFRFPLFIEKPLYSSLDIEDLVNFAVDNNIKTYIACNLRFLDCIRFVKESFIKNKNKKLNEVNVYCGSYLPGWRSNVDFRRTYSANAELGGGVHIDLIHELDYLYWLFGLPQKVNRTFNCQSTLAISSYDYANYVLEYNGFSASVILNYYRRDSKRTLELVFEDDTWNIDLLKNHVTCNNQIIYSSEQQIADTYQIQMEYFISCIKNKKSTFNTIKDAFEVLQICLEQ